MVGEIPPALGNVRPDVGKMRLWPEEWNRTWLHASADFEFLDGEVEGSISTLDIAQPELASFTNEHSCAAQNCQ